MKILLTGPTGFIGSAFARLALQQGHGLAGLVIPSETIPPDLIAAGSPVWLRGTLAEPPWNEIAAFKADVCVHTAWITAPGVYLESPENFAFLEASVKFLRQLREFGTRHILALGTCIEYQSSHQPLREDTSPVIPATTYARCKNELRLKLEADAKKEDFRFCWGRVFYPYGPREHPSRLCSSIIQKLSRGEKLVLKTPRSTKDYIYIEDLAAAVLLLVEKQFHGTINLGTGIAVTVKEIARQLGEIMGKPELIEENNQSAVDPLDYVVADASRLHSLGWQPAHDLRRGLERVVAAKKAAMTDAR